MHKFILPLLITLPFCLQAQFNLGFDHYDDIKVVHNGDTLRHAWSGGLNNPQFSSLDVNVDGIDDIYAFERDGEVTRLFINDGTGHFTADMHSYKKLPALSKVFRRSFALMRDYDGDGKSDLFTSGFNNYGIDVYRNVSDTTLKFELAAERLKYAREGAGSLYFYVPTNDLPAIDDIDGDGDLDILVQGQVDFTPYVLLYIENRSQDLYNSNDSLRFKLKNPCWGKVREYVSQTGWTEYVCDTGLVNNRGNRHGGTTLATVDLNDDGLTDLLTGDAYNEHLISLINVEDNIEADLDLSLSDTTFPNYGQPAQVPTLPAAYLEDIDQDGVRDMLVAPNQLTAFASFYLDTSINTKVDWYYRNTGTNTNPNYELQEEGFFSGQMVDVGARSFPATVDINGDGLLDLVVGNEGYTVYGGTAAASLTLYLNVGTESNPVFKLHTKDLAGVASMGFGTAHPTFADIDNDEDFDLIVGDDQGKLHFFKNKGVSTVWDFHLTEPNFAEIDVGLSAHPFFFDLNSDNLEDLIIGDYYGQFHYYENAGTETEWDFSMNPTIEKMGDVQTYFSHGGEATPFVTRKLDSLGANLYILIGSADGTILVYGPITNIYEDLEPSDSISVDATFTSPTGANLYGDFRHELLIGQRTGGLFAMRRVQEIGVGMTGPANPAERLQLFPNPSNGQLHVRAPQMASGDARIRVYDSRGRLVHAHSVPSDAPEVSLDLGALSAGLYLVEWRDGNRHLRERWIKE